MLAAGGGGGSGGEGVFGAEYSADDANGQPLAAVAGWHPEKVFPDTLAGDWWIVIDVRDPTATYHQHGKQQTSPSTPGPAPKPVMHGDPVAFKHYLTGKMLHSHNVAAPLTSTHQEVSRSSLCC
jgi:hypothetical protein